MATHPWVATCATGPVRFGIQAILGQDAGTYRRMLDTATLADGLGFDAYYIFDHPLLQADPWTCLPAAAMVTGRIRLGSAVNCAAYRHPAMLARLCADLDGISEGRAILGLGSGWLEREYAALGMPYPSTRDRQDLLDETLAIVRGTWAQPPFSYTGRLVSTTAMEVLPPPVQQPCPPILIGGSGEQRTLRQVAQWGDACNVKEDDSTTDGTFAIEPRAAQVARKLAALDRHCADLNRPRAEVLATHFTLFLMLGESTAAARRKYDAFDPSTSSSPGTRRAGKQGIVCGSPDDLLAYYQALVDAGIDYFVVQLDARDHETITLLATEIMPRIVRQR